MRALGFLLALIGLGACVPDGTGVLLRIQGTLAIDTLSIEAQLPDRSITREATVPSGILPTTYLAKLPDADTTVSFAVRAKHGGLVVAEATTALIRVSAHTVTEAMVELGSVGLDLGDSDARVEVDGGGGFVVQRGGAPAATAILTSVFGFGADELYVTSLSTGGANLLRTSDRGTTWTPAGVGVGSPALHGGWGASPSSIVLVGEGGTLLRGSGASFAAETTPAGTRTLRGVWGVSPTSIYVVGDGNTILHSVVGGWVQQTPLGTRSLHGIWASDASHLWAVGDSGAILFSTGNGLWSLQASGSSATLRAVFGRSATEVYAVGDDGTILRSTGNGSWSAQPSPRPGVALYGLHQRASGELFAVGEGWTVLRSAGDATWSVLDTGLAPAAATSSRLRGAWVSAAADLYVVGAGETILRSPL